MTAPIDETIRCFTLVVDHVMCKESDCGSSYGPGILKTDRQANGLMFRNEAYFHYDPWSR